MTRGHRVLTIGLAAMMIGAPLATHAQMGTKAPGTATAPGTTTAPAPGTATPPPAGTGGMPGISPPPPAGSSTSPTPGASPAGPSETSGGLASPRTPMIQADCTHGRWQQFGFSEAAACVNALPARTR